MNDQFEALRKTLEAPITPLPWKVGPLFDNDGTLERIIGAMDDAACVAVTLDFGANNPGMRDANAALIVAAANAIPSVLSEFSRLRAEVERLRAPLSEHEKHALIERCGMVTGPNLKGTYGQLYRSLATATNVWEGDLFNLIDAARSAAQGGSDV